ncbi:hypothetical protein ACTWPB_07440 [Nocardia sp. IBHARD005]|uniref:hypothetical protein n=1 Tax=Nocardia sp. IBHARD005 TaxID=3457765 RepID=UPI00405921A9
MTEQMIKPTGLELMRLPFADHQVSQLPKPYKKESPKADCRQCGGYHGLPAMHLNYVGHAALTDRLLDVDPMWTWEPVAMDDTGLPRLDRNGGLWIRLTVCGVTRYGYGDADGKSGGNAIKEAIGDALRNAAMRFGAALDLWHKGDLHEAEQKRGTPPSAADLAAQAAHAARTELRALLDDRGIDPALAVARFAELGHGDLAKSQNPDPIRELIAHYEEGK